MQISAVEMLKITDVLLDKKVLLQVYYETFIFCVNKEVWDKTAQSVKERAQVTITELE